MSRIMLCGDAHLGHKNIHKYRTDFATAEEHHETIWENIQLSVNKRDTLIMMGDTAFTHEWLRKIELLNVKKKILIVGNHCTENGINMRHIVNAYDEVHGALSYRNYWLTHIPMHPQEIRGRKANIHGHLHGNHVWMEERDEISPGEYFSPIDQRYLSTCLEHTDWKPVSWQELTE